MNGSMQTGSGTPIVTEGAAGSRQPYGDFFSAYERMQQLRQPQSSGGFFDFSPAQQSALDRLGALGAAMASTRSPTFAGALGEGLQALQRTAASQRQEERQNRQLDVEAAYRAAQEARQMAEFEYARDPTNPLYQLRVAQTRQAEAQAQAALMNARTSAAGPQLPVMQGEYEGRPATFNPNTRQMVQAPEGFARTASPAQQALEDQRRVQDFATADRMARANLSDDPMWPSLPQAERNRRIESERSAIMAQLRALRSGTTGAGLPQQPATTTAPTSPQGRPGDISIPYIAP